MDVVALVVLTAYLFLSEYLRIVCKIYSCLNSDKSPRRKTLDTRLTLQPNKMAPVESIVPTASLGYPYSLEKNHGLDGDNLANNLFTKASPDFLTGPLVWSGADFKGNQAYTLQLSEEDVVEIDNALSHFKSQKHHET